MHTLLSRSIGIAITVGGGLLTSCLAADDESMTESADGAATDELFALAGSAWSTRDVPVCFLTPGYSTQKQWIREALTGDWSWQAFGNVNFTNWGTCSGTGQRIQIQLTTSSAFPPETAPGLGQDPNGQSTTITLRVGNLNLISRCTSNGLADKECIQVVALHEFGHALGFDHEFVNTAGIPAQPPCPEGTIPNQGGNLSLTRYDPQSIMNYCNWPRYLSPRDRFGMSEFYGHPNRDTSRLADYNGDGRADLLFHDRTTGYVRVHYATSGGLYAASASFQGSVAFCTGHTQRLFVGHFNSGGGADLLCHDMATGTKRIDYAASGPLFLPLFGGVDWTGGGGWCALPEQRLVVGDYNGDGLDDLLCHNTLTGVREIDFNSGNSTSPFSWYDAAWGPWCNGPMLRLYAGRFDADGVSDLLCHNHNNGDTSVDYSWNGLAGTDWSRGAAWCDKSNPGAPLDGTEELFISDLQGDGLDDLICQDFNGGGKALDYNQNGQFAGTDWIAGFAWCGGADHRLYTGDVNGDGWEDLVCRSPWAGHTYVDWSSNQLAGSEAGPVLIGGGAQFTAH